MDIEDGYLIDKNRSALRKIFQHHTAASSSHLLPFSELIKFSSSVRIFPDLLSSFELKRIIARLTGKHAGQDSDLSITYLQFERLIKHIAGHCFHEPGGLQLLISHIRNPCSLHYKVTLATDAKEVSSDAPRPTSKGWESQRQSKRIEDLTQRKPAPVFRLSSVLKSPEHPWPTRAKEVNSKVRELYALISPRASSLLEQRRSPVSALTGRQTQSPEVLGSSLGKSLKASLFDFETEPRLSALYESSAVSPRAKAPQEQSNKELLSDMVRVFTDFKARMAATVEGRRVRPLAKALALVRCIRRHSVLPVLSRQRLVLALSFKLWALQGKKAGVS